MNAIAQRGLFDVEPNFFCSSNEFGQNAYLDNGGKVRSGFGLSMLRDRVRILCGKIDFHSDNNLTRFIITIPINEVKK